MRSKILILSHTGDVHLEYVTSHLVGEEVILLNPADMIDGDTIDYMFENGRLNVYYQDEPLNNVKSIWVRRPTMLTSRALPVRMRHAAYVRSAAERHLNMFYDAFPDALWFSSMASIKAADIKIVQLRLAAKLGFNVPETLFASSPSRAKEFVEKHSTVIAKTQTQKIPFNKVIFTKIVRSTDPIDYSGLNLDPHTFQQYIEPKAEWRVTVVGEHVFVVAVSGEEIDGITSKFRDWRVSHANDTFKAEKIQVPKAFERQCIAYVRELRLEFGALDFIVDKNGIVWFLEINPNGQWAFVEIETGMPIGKTIANKLMTGRH